jgi:hypothetical protein
MSVAAVVYVLCALTALGCALLLLRAFAATRTRLVLWAGLCFSLLTLSNALIVVDLQVVRAVDLFMWRNLAALAGLSLFAFGLIWDSR